ncbi:MAG TPA: hypothetical protein VF062_25685 [Candidatus Limnocylindrales bacterium]
MTAKAFAAALLLVVLGGCTAQEAPQGSPKPHDRSQEAPKPHDPELTAPPVPILKVGDPAALDLFGDGQATVTIAATERTTQPDRLVVTIDLVLNKAGKPITGGPHNFVFRDAGSEMHKAQTSADAFPPELLPVAFTTAGQRSHGRLYFDVPAGSVAGGYIQLVTGALVHAVWKI